MLHVDTASIVANQDGSAAFNSRISGVASSIKWPTTTASIGCADTASTQKWRLAGVVPLQNCRMYEPFDSGAGPLIPFPIDLMEMNEPTHVVSFGPPRLARDTSRRWLGGRRP